MPPTEAWLYARCVSQVIDIFSHNINIRGPAQMAWRLLYVLWIKTVPNHNTFRELGSMFRGLYYNGLKKKRCLTIDEVARACHISTEKAENLVAQKKLKKMSSGVECIDNIDFLWFLLCNNMPVSSSLLPPRTVKLLFVGSNSCELREKEDVFEQICKMIAQDASLVLAESAINGRQAHLSILTYSPDVVVLFQRSFSSQLADTVEFLAGLPEIRKILFIDAATKIAIDNGLVSLPVDLILSNNLSSVQLNTLLSEFFKR